jgi:hypothetical protein
MLTPKTPNAIKPGKKKPRARKSTLTVQDLTLRRDSKSEVYGGAKSSPVSLPIPPQGFIASSGD